MACTRTRLSLAVALAVGSAPHGALAADGEPTPVLSAALGIKAGFIPPLLAVPELVIHTPHLFLGAFGIYTTGGIGNGGNRLTLGGELAYEVNAAGQNTPYFSTGFFQYDAAKNAIGFYEKTSVLTVTGGYEWKARHFEFQLGAGGLFILKEQTPPCSGWFCFNFRQSVLPALDLSLRYRL